MKYIDFCTYVHGTKQEETTGGRCLHPAAYQLLGGRPASTPALVRRDTRRRVLAVAAQIGRGTGRREIDVRGAVGCVDKKRRSSIRRGVV